MENNKNCPCDTCSVVKDLKKTIEEQAEKIIDCQIKFATINTKLNLVVGILSAIGVAMLGVIMKIMF